MSAPSIDEQSVQSGTMLDNRYRIEAVLGEGGMASVYLATHTGLGRAVAIKMINTRGVDRELIDRFRREALVGGRLDHKNIVAVSDFGVHDDGRSYLVMEALEGEVLATRIERGPVPWREAVEIAAGVLHGLRHAHERGVVHRDIKPGNIFLARKDGEQVVKLLDFGIAKLFAGGEGGSITKTRDGLTVGTPAYLSPEQAVGGEITPASDLYSTTVVLFEMLSGRRPFEAPELVAVMMAHVGREPPAVRDVAPTTAIPPALETVIQRGLRKLPAERFASAQEYLALLDEVMLVAGPAVPADVQQPVFARRDSAPVTAVPDAFAPTDAHLAATPSTAPAAPPAKLSIAAPGEPLPRRWIVTAALVIVLAVVLAIVLGVTRDSTAPTRTARKPRPGDAAKAPPQGETMPPPAPSIPASSDLDRDTRLKAALHDLDTGETCADRKAAVAKLVELDDERAIPQLKRARYRMRGGVLGVFAKNTNACLTKEAEEAIKRLSERHPQQ